jgi:hypothetical protein
MLGSNDVSPPSFFRAALGKLGLVVRDHQATTTEMIIEVAKKGERGPRRLATTIFKTHLASCQWMMSLSASLISMTISAMSSRMIFFFVSAVAPGLSHARARSLPNDINRSRSDKLRVSAVPTCQQCRYLVTQDFLR